MKVFIVLGIVSMLSPKRDNWSNGDSSEHEVLAEFDLANGETIEEINCKDNHIAMSEGSKHVFNLCNSIIGVSLLAMPFCFKRCGIILGIVMVMASVFLTRFTSHLLMKASLLCRKSNYEVLAFHAYGPIGKFTVEASIICFMLGVLVSFFVIIGDIAPDIVTGLAGIESFPALRTVVLTAIGLAVGLPLGLLRSLSSLGPISTLAMAFYGLLTIKIIADALPVLTSENWADSVLWWEPDGILVCLPIFSLALACQTQLFEVYDVLHEPSLGKMNKLVKQAVNICACGYIAVGFFGYIAFYNTDFTGNILMAMQPSLLSQLIKLAFAASIVCSIPLVVFPCRTSLYSLLYRRNYTPIDVGASRVTNDTHFRVITCVIVIFTLIMGIMFPNIELVLELNGSTIGTIICLIFPAILFIRVTSRNTFERTGAQVVFCAGVFILVVCTYITLHHAFSLSENHIAAENVIAEPIPEHQKAIPSLDSGVPDLRIKSEGPARKVVKPDHESVKLNDIYEAPKVVDKSEPEISNEKKKPAEVQYVRQEPPIPQEPEIMKEAAKVLKEEVKAANEEKKVVNVEERKDEGLNPEKLKVAAESKPAAAPVVTEKAKEQKQVDVGAKQEELLQKLQAQQEEQKQLIQQQKQLLEELKAHKDTHFKDIDPSPISDKNKHDKGKSPVLPNIVLEPGNNPIQKSNEGQMEEAVPLPIKSLEHRNEVVSAGIDKAKIEPLSPKKNFPVAPGEDRIDNVDIPKKVIPEQTAAPLLKQDKEKPLADHNTDTKLPAPSVRQSLLVPLVNASRKFIVPEERPKPTVTPPVVLNLGIPAEPQLIKEDIKSNPKEQKQTDIKKLDKMPTLDTKKVNMVGNVAPVEPQQPLDKRAEIRKREAKFQEINNQQLLAEDENCERSTDPPYGCQPPDTNKLVQHEGDDKNVREQTDMAHNVKSHIATNKTNVSSNVSSINLSQQKSAKLPPLQDAVTKFPSKVHSSDSNVHSNNHGVVSSAAEASKVKTTTLAHRAKDEQR